MIRARGYQALPGAWTIKTNEIVSSAFDTGHSTAVLIRVDAHKDRTRKGPFSIRVSSLLRCRRTPDDNDMNKP